MGKLLNKTQHSLQFCKANSHFFKISHLIHIMCL